MISDEELKRTFLQPEGVGPGQLGEEPVEELRQDLLGNSLSAGLSSGS